VVAKNLPGGKLREFVRGVIYSWLAEGLLAGLVHVPKTHR